MQARQRKICCPIQARFYLANTSLPSDRGGYVDLDGDGRWWIPSGRVFFHPAEDCHAWRLKLVEATATSSYPAGSANPFAQSSFVDYANDLFPAQDNATHLATLSRPC